METRHYEELAKEEPFNGDIRVDETFGGRGSKALKREEKALKDHWI